MGVRKARRFCRGSNAASLRKDTRDTSPKNTIHHFHDLGAASTAGRDEFAANTKGTDQLFWLSSSSAGNLTILAYETPLLLGYTEMSVDHNATHAKRRMGRGTYQIEAVNEHHTTKRAVHLARLQIRNLLFRQRRSHSDSHKHVHVE